MLYRVVRVIAQGVFVASLGIFLLWLTLPAGVFEQTPPRQAGIFDNAFARRWDGTCTGWTENLARFHVINDLLLWNAYVVVALVMWRLHPIIKRAPGHKITLQFVCLVFLTCGATHLFSAYVVFNPVYVFDGSFKLFAGAIGAIAGFMVARDLVTTHDKIKEEHRRLDILEARMEGDTLRHKTVGREPLKRSRDGRILRVFLESLAVSTLVALLLWFTDRSPVSQGLFRNQFACQWTGACTGWTKPLALLYVAGSLVTWAAYVLQGWVVLRLHPISRRVGAAKLMIPAVTLVLMGCGSVHLVEAYAIFNPIFVALAWQKLVIAAVSLLGAVLVSLTLVAVFDATVRDRERLQELETKLAA